MLVEGRAVETNDTVPSRLLRHVQRIIRSSYERITVLETRIGPRRHATAHRTLEGAAVKRERVRLYCFTRALGEGNGCIQHSSGQQEHKLFATIAAHAVDLSRFLFQDSRELS